jgi:hypothetical protein
MRHVRMFTSRAQLHKYTAWLTGGWPSALDRDVMG